MAEHVAFSPGSAFGDFGFVRLMAGYKRLDVHYDLTFTLQDPVRMVRGQ